jgi:hypothetical protein
MFFLRSRAYIISSHGALLCGCSLDWDQTVVDGLYDVWGQFPEILEIAPDSGVTKLFPSLDELSRIPFTPGDSREVTSHNHFHGPATRMP